MKLLASSSLRGVVCFPFLRTDPPVVYLFDSEGDITRTTVLAIPGMDIASILSTADADNDGDDVVRARWWAPPRVVGMILPAFIGMCACPHAAVRNERVRAPVRATAAGCHE